MEIIYNKIFLKHETGYHPENKARLLAFGNLKETQIESGEKYLELIHSKEHIALIKNAPQQTLALDSDTLTSSYSYAVACFAVGAAILASEVQGFALVRPPGHHSYSNRASGFCLFNNIAIATQKLVNAGKKVAIIDIDGHYGNGTSDIFYCTDKVLYCSLHQYPAYPGNGSVDEIGESIGKGYNVSVPLPSASADDLFIDAIENIFIPVMKQFKPDVVGVSAGFDAYQHDPLLNLKVSYNGFFKAGKLLSENFSNIFATLEGGYNTEALPNCVYNFVDGVNGAEQRFKEEITSSLNFTKEEYDFRIKKLKKNLSPYWML